MSIEGLEQYSKDQLIAELINRQTLVGIVVFHRSDAKAGQLEPGETVIAKSPPLSREGVEALLNCGMALTPQLFCELNSDSPLGAIQSPLSAEPGGVVRIGGSRISLDLIVELYESGMTPEEMVRAYDTLKLADVYATIAYYLQHRPAVEAYLKRRAEEAASLRAKIEGERSRAGSESLLALRSATESTDAPDGE